MPVHLPSARLRILLACVLAALAAMLMLVPIETLQAWLPVPDSVNSATTIGLGSMTVSTAVHVGLFVLLGMALPLLWPERAAWQRLLLALALALGFELLQLLTDARVAKWEDAVTNVASIVFGLVLSALWLLRQSARPAVDSVQ